MSAPARLETPQWVRLLFGPDTVSEPVTSLKDVVEQRWTELPYANDELPLLVQMHVVDLWERDGHVTSSEVYVPAGAGPFPVFLYMHGGGWCHGSAASVRRLAMRLSEQGFVVLNLSYALAPEHPFPRAVEDTVYAARWLAVNVETYGGDARRLAVGGDSAGANLALAAITYLGGGAPGDQIEEGDLAGVEVGFGAALLLYGIYDFPLLVSSPTGPSGTVEVMFNHAYLGPAYIWRHRNPLVSPIRATNLASFPPCYVACGDQDYLLPQSLALVGTLAAARVPVTASIVPGVSHAFAQLDRQLPAAHHELNRQFDWLHGLHLVGPDA
jgi:acetyl esterase